MCIVFRSVVRSVVLSFLMYVFIYVFMSLFLYFFIPLVFCLFPRPSWFSSFVIACFVSFVLYVCRSFARSLFVLDLFSYWFL